MFEHISFPRMTGGTTSRREDVDDDPPFVFGDSHMLEADVQV